MTVLNPTRTDELIQLLIPYMTRVSNRQQFVTQALAESPALLDSINYAGDPRQFTTHLVRMCDQFGAVVPGRLALIALLEHLQMQAETDDLPQIERLLAEIHRLEKHASPRQSTRTASREHADHLARHIERHRRFARFTIVMSLVMMMAATGAGVFAAIQIKHANTAQARVVTQVAELDILRGVQLTPVAMMTYLPPTSRFDISETWVPVTQEFDGVRMVFVPAGCFLMGSNAGGYHKRPAHQQCVDESFWIDETEVRQAQFVRMGGVKAQPNSFEGDQRPVENITWYEARDFCKLRGARLPSEVEWEYAARGPESLFYPWGNEFVATNAIYTGNSNGITADVGSRPGGASWVGALDMSGNVSEWVHSFYAPYPYTPLDGRETLVSAVSDGRVLRGGSWNDASANLRAPDRDAGTPHYAYGSWGFRCARSS